MISRREEEYLEAIYFMSRERDVVRLVDVAERLGVRPPSAFEVLSRLASKGLVEYRGRGGVVLTERGEELARELAAKHSTLTRFLVEILGVPREIGEEDACYLEHKIHDETLKRISAFLEFALSCRFNGRTLAELFREYLERGECAQ